MQFENQKRIFFCIKTYSLDACDVYELPRLIPSGFGCWVVEKHALESAFSSFSFWLFFLTKMTNCAMRGMGTNSFLWMKERKDVEGK